MWGRLAVALTLGACTVVGTSLALGLAEGRAHAGTRLTHKRVVPYPRAQAWPAAIRYLRVDRGYAIVDRDPELGYVLFEFPLPGSKTGRGSLEMLEATDDAGRPSASLEVNTEAGPAHLPHALAEGIATKLREERGPPAAPPQPPAPHPNPGPQPPKPPADDYILEPGENPVEPGDF